MQHFRAFLALAFAASLTLTSTAEARLTRLEVNKREIVADGMAFGTAGAYEKLTGRVWFEADPALERNAAVFDIDRAPRNGRGVVEFSADMVILKPVDMTKSAATLFFEVNNRGRKISFGRMHDTASDANMNAPMTARDFGNGFLMNRGYVLAWVGWGADIAPGDNRLTVNFPVAHENGTPVAERILTEFSDRNFNGGKPTSLPLSGGAAFKSFAAVSTDRKEAQAELYVTASDSPRPSGPGIPRGEPASDDEWAFADCPDGWPGKPSVEHICLKSGFRNDRNYHLLYRATDSPVMGLGYLTSRDFVSFLKHDAKDGAGNPNPVFGIRTTLCQGISSSGMYLRDFLYHGFNADENDRRVCDGMHIHVAGVQKLFLNYRFAQPNAFTQQHRERFVPDTNFPRQYAVRINPATNTPDGILKRPLTDPKIIHTDTSNEYWQFRASLTGASEGGTMDFNESLTGAPIPAFQLAARQLQARRGTSRHRQPSVPTPQQPDAPGSAAARIGGGAGRLGEEEHGAAGHQRPTGRGWHARACFRTEAAEDSRTDLRRPLQRLWRPQFRPAGARKFRRDRPVDTRARCHPQGSGAAGGCDRQ
jgi:hypothetical protein